MGLIHCPDCGTEVSDKAKVCPRCSYPISAIGKTRMSDDNSTPYVWLGYVSACLSLFFFPILFMVAGIACGVYCISRHDSGHGIAQIALSLVLGILGFIWGITYEFLYF